MDMKMPKTAAQWKEYNEERAGREYLESEARRQGLQYVEPGPRDIFVDLDFPEDKWVLEANLATLREAGVKLEVVKEIRSKNGGKHVYLQTVEGLELDPFQRVLLQAVLGSDRKREALAMARLLDGWPEPVTCFFEVPKPLDPVDDEKVPF